MAGLGGALDILLNGGTRGSLDIILNVLFSTCFYLPEKYKFVLAVIFYKAITPSKKKIFSDEQNVIIFQKW
jgi:hypothetical protein